jgi:extradiol dioxygenase family protein
MPLLIAQRVAFTGRYGTHRTFVRRTNALALNGFRDMQPVFAAGGPGGR